MTSSLEIQKYISSEIAQNSYLSIYFQENETKHRFKLTGEGSDLSTIYSPGGSLFIGFHALREIKEDLQIHFHAIERVSFLNKQNLVRVNEKEQGLRFAI